MVSERVAFTFSPGSMFKYSKGPACAALRNPNTQSPKPTTLQGISKRYRVQTPGPERLWKAPLPQTQSCKPRVSGLGLERFRLQGLEQLTGPRLIRSLRQNCKPLNPQPEIRTATAPVAWHGLDGNRRPMERSTYSGAMPAASKFNYLAVSYFM